MPRDNEIKDAFISAIRRIPGERVTVTTQDFVCQLELLNWHPSLRKINQWIKSATATFLNISHQESEAKTHKQFNLNV